MRSFPSVRCRLSYEGPVAVVTRAGVPGRATPGPALWSVLVDLRRVVRCSVAVPHPLLTPIPGDSRERYLRRPCPGDLREHRDAHGRADSGQKHSPRVSEVDQRSPSGRRGQFEAAEDHVVHIVADDGRAAVWLVGDAFDIDQADPVRVAEVKP